MSYGPITYSRPSPASYEAPPAYGYTLVKHGDRAMTQTDAERLAADPILRAIERLEEPHIVDAARHAMLLRALADSPILQREHDVREWLHDLAEILDWARTVSI